MKTTTAERYKCSNCSSRQTPENIHAGADGIKKSEPKKALEEQEATPVVEEVKSLEPLTVVETQKSDSPPKKKAKTIKKKRRRF